jgi:hypothetical protein
LLQCPPLAHGLPSRLGGALYEQPQAPQESTVHGLASLQADGLFGKTQLPSAQTYALPHLSLGQEPGLMVSSRQPTSATQYCWPQPPGPGEGQRLELAL